MSGILHRAASGVLALGLLAASSGIAQNAPGTVWSWGDNQSGQLGTNSATASRTPVRVTGPGGVGFLDGARAVAAGSFHSVALLTNGTVWTWGANGMGQLGDGSSASQRLAPTQVVGPGGQGFLTGVIAIAAGSDHVLALKADGTVWAWGSNSHRQLGDPTAATRNTPGPVPGPGGSGTLSGVVGIAAGFGHSLALKADGSVWAWGLNEFQLLGVGSTNPAEAFPMQVRGPGGTGNLSQITGVSSGSMHSLALRADGTVWAWGLNIEGQLGDDTLVARATPVQVRGPTGPLTGVVAVAAGLYHGLALRSDGSVWAWGRNSAGQLGDGSTERRRLAVQVTGPDGFQFLTSVVALAQDGAERNFAARADGTLWAWGENSRGSLGDNSTDNQTRPVQVQGPAGSGVLTGTTAVGAGAWHALAVVTPAGQPRFQPDMLARTWSTSWVCNPRPSGGCDWTYPIVAGLYVGDNIYGSSGATQRISNTVYCCGGLSHAILRVQNDGNGADRYRISAPPASNGFTARYYDATGNYLAAVPQGGNDITAEVNGSGWTTPSIAPGAYLELRVTLQFNFPPTQTSPITSLPVAEIPVTATSVGDASKRDTVLIGGNVQLIF